MEIKTGQIISASNECGKVIDNFKCYIAVTLNTYTSVLEQFKEREFDKVNPYYLNENLIGNNFLYDVNNIKAFER